MNHDTQEQDLHDSEALATIANDLGQRRVKMSRPPRRGRPPKEAALRPSKRIKRYRRGSLLAGAPVLY